MISYNILEEDASLDSIVFRDKAMVAVQINDKIRIFKFANPLMPEMIKEISIKPLLENIKNNKLQVVDITL